MPAESVKPLSGKMGRNPRLPTRGAASSGGMFRAMQILLVEDDPGMQASLQRALSCRGMQVQLASDGLQALAQWSALAPDAVVLDLSLPGLDGLEVLAQGRAQGLRTPVLVLTARGSTGERVQGLNLGADDYLTKPFELAELEARIKALLRRSEFGLAAPASAVLAFDEWRLDTISHRLFHRDGEEVMLSGADFALLKLFLDHPQQILDRDTIGNATRGREPMPLDRIVDMAVSRLRQRLRDTDKPPRLIRTVRGSGYLLAAHVCNAP